MKGKKRSGNAGERAVSLARRSACLAGVIGIACLTLFCISPISSGAKEKKPLTKTVRGEVLDASNNPIVGASVELTDETAGTTLGLYTLAGGHYQFTDLKPNHDYKVQAKYKGLVSEVRHASSLDDRGIVVLNLIIPPSASP